MPTQSRHEFFLSKHIGTGSKRSAPMSAISAVFSKRLSGLFALCLLVIFSAGLKGCALYAVADSAVTVAATGVKTAAKVVGGAASLAIDAVIPSDREEKRKLEALKRICQRNPDYSECRALKSY